MIRALILSLCLLTIGPAGADTTTNQLPTLGDRASGVVSPEQEYRLGRAWLRQLRAHVSTIEDPLIYDYLEHLLYLLASSSDLAAPNLALVVINSPQINAFAVPGGVIGLNAGLLLHARAEDELAAVIAHELAHLSQRHFARGQDYNQRTQWATAAALLASVVLMATAGSDAGMAALATTQATAIDQQLRFSRSNELEADRIGMQTLVRANMNPQAMPDFFEELLKSKRFSGELPPEFLLTHPITQKRISDSRNRADAFPRTGYSDSLEFQLMRIRAKVAYTREDTAAIRELESNLREQKTGDEEVTRYGLAYAYFRANQYDDALKTLAPLIEKRPNRITYLYTRAAILMEQNDYSTASTQLQQALGFSPDNYPLSMAYAESLLRLGKAQEALKALRKQQRNKPLLPGPLYLMAECYGKLGDNLGVHEARAEHYFLTGKLDRALEQLRYALDLAQEDFQAHARIKDRMQTMLASKNDLKL